MKAPEITEEKVKEKLKKLKKKKAAGPSGLKPELYKAIGKSTKLLKIITKCL